MFGLGNLNLIIKSKIPKMAPPLKWAPYLTKYPSNWPKFKIGVQHFLKRSLSFLHGQVMKQQALVLLISLLPIFSKLLLLRHYNTTYWLTFKLNVTMSKSVFRSKLKMLILTIYNSICFFSSAATVIRRFRIWNFRKVWRYIRVMYILPELMFQIISQP